MLLVACTNLQRSKTDSVAQVVSTCSDVAQAETCSGAAVSEGPDDHQPTLAKIAINRDPLLLALSPATPLPHPTAPASKHRVRQSSG
jgi:hypothetical protein